MKLKSLTISTLAALAMSVSLAATSQAVMVAGWDFSQYVAPNALSVDGANGTNVLSANYSNLDPTAGLGVESAAFGQMYMNGQFLSTDVDPLSASPQFSPNDAQIDSNLGAPGAGFPPFNSTTDLVDEGGQMFGNPWSMSAQGLVSVVFGANLTSVPLIGSDWAISFGARTFAGTSSIGIEFSSDGVNYLNFGSVNLTTTDTPYNVVLGTLATDLAFVRLSFQAPGAGGVSQAIVDNVAIHASTMPQVPEPGAALLCVLGVSLATLSGLRRQSVRA